MSLRAVRPAIVLAAMALALAGCGGIAMETSSRASSKDFLIGVPSAAAVSAVAPADWSTGPR